MPEDTETLLQKIMRYQSAPVLILANLIPLFGVIIWHWDAFSVVFLFWMENVVIGFFNVLKMLVTGAIGGDRGSPAMSMLRFAGSLFMACFFTFHYGMFTAVHGMFVVTLLGGGMNGSGGFLTVLSGTLTHAFAGGLGLAILALFASHAFSFLFNFLWNREYSRVQLDELMSAPYGRIVVLHIAILFGGFVSMALGSPMGVLIILVVLKTALDLKFHLKEREKGTIGLLAKRGSPAAQ